MRVNRQQVPGHPDNRGIVVSHIGLNLDRHWDDFKTLDAEDQQLVQAWLMGEERRPAPASEAGERLPLIPDMVVRHELTLDASSASSSLRSPTRTCPTASWKPSAHKVSTRCGWPGP